MKPFENTTLIFSCLQDLTDFEHAVRPHVLVIDTGMLTITGAFAEAEVELAINGFRAKVQSEGSTIS